MEGLLGYLKEEEEEEEQEQQQNEGGGGSGESDEEEEESDEEGGGGEMTEAEARGMVAALLQQAILARQQRRRAQGVEAEEDEEEDGEGISIAIPGALAALLPPHLFGGAQAAHHRRTAVSLPVAYTSKDTTVRPPRPPRADGRRRKAVRWADPALLESEYAFYADRPVDPTAPPEGRPESPDEKGNKGEEEGGGAAAAHYRPLEVVSVERRKRGAAGGGGGGVFGSLPTTGRGKWEGPSARARKRQRDATSPTTGTAATATGNNGPYDAAEWEFFCDACGYTVERGEVRYECRLCPDEFCLCRLCYHKHSTTPIHPHPCLPSTAPFHVTVLPPPVAPVVNGKDAGAEEEEEEELEEEEEDRGARAAMAVG